MTAPLLEIEVNDSHNRDLFFPPLGRRVRGRIEAARAVKHNKEAAKLAIEWPEPIPGQRLGIDAETGEGYLLEPLHDDEHTVTRELVMKQWRLEPRIKKFPVDKPTWLWWLKAAVESGHATVRQGELPETIEGDVKKAFVVTREKSQESQLADAIREQTAALREQSTLFTKLLTELVGRRK